MTIIDFGPIGPALSLIAVAGVVISYLLLRREMRMELSRLQGMLTARPVADSASPPAPAQTEARPSPVPAPKKSKEPPASAREEITPEILAVIAAAVAQFVGAGARIRSTRLVASPGGMSPWAQQGRVIIQASHNLGVR